MSVDKIECKSASISVSKNENCLDKGSILHLQKTSQLESLTSTAHGIGQEKRD